VYGQDGFNVIQDTVNYPSYATVSVTGNTPHVWASSTSDVRALERAVSGRIAGLWYSAASMTMDVDLTDGQMHRIGLYNLDWDNIGRVQTVEILDAADDTVLDTRTVSNFGGGEYLVWNVQGHVKIRVTRTSGANAVVSGIFFGNP